MKWNLALLLLAITMGLADNILFKLAVPDSTAHIFLMVFILVLIFIAYRDFIANESVFFNIVVYSLSVTITIIMSTYIKAIGFVSLIRWPEELVRIGFISLTGSFFWTAFFLLLRSLGKKKKYRDKSGASKYGS